MNKNKNVVFTPLIFLSSLLHQWNPLIFPKFSSVGVILISVSVYLVRYIWMRKWGGIYLRKSNFTNGHKNEESDSPSSRNQSFWSGAVTPFLHPLWTMIRHSLVQSLSKQLQTLWAHEFKNYVMSRTQDFTPSSCFLQLFLPLFQKVT